MSVQQTINGLQKLLPEWMSKQRWFSSGEESPQSARIVEHEVLRSGSPTLLWTLVEVEDAGDKKSTYQVPIGLRGIFERGDVLLGHPLAEIGEVETDAGPVAAYDALVDPVLSRSLFDLICDGQETVKSVRPVGAEQSNTSLVYDNRLILKIFRRLYEGRNPDLEVTLKLTEAGFKNIAPVIATWQRGNLDLAVGQPYLFDGTEGWKMALASVRDFLGVDTAGASGTAGSPSKRIEHDDPARAGGDFGAESLRLGEVTATMHIELSKAFGTHDFETKQLIESLRSGLDVVVESQRGPLEELIKRVEAVPSGQAGKASRVHGDYHLGQTLRSASGWYLFDFEGEPARPLTERVRETSPVKDVTGMLRSFAYAAAVGLSDHTPANRASLEDKADAWDQRNRAKFLDGYMAVEGIETLLPADDEARQVIFTAFEVEKAIYELGYEKAYRPSWVGIPTSALERLLKQ